MDYFSKSQAIALPLSTTSEKEPFNPPTSDPPAPSSSSRRTKIRPKFLIILLPLLLIGLSLGWVFYARFHKKAFCCNRRSHFDHQFHHPSNMQFMGNHGLGTQVGNVRCDTMAQWSSPEEIVNNDRYNPEPRFSSNTTFSFPLSSKSLLFYAYGHYSTGDIAFVEDDTNSDDIAVDINVKYWSQEDLDEARICTLQRAAGEGLGIFTADRIYNAKQQRNEILFKISVRFPKSSDDKPVIVKKLETVLPMFSHQFPKANIHFDSLSVTTSQFPIWAESLSVKSAKLETTGNILMGTYTVTDYLKLTTNAPMFLNVTMNNANNGVPTRLSVKSNKALLHANISLFSNDGSGGDFTIDASNFNAPLHVKVPVAPVDHVLHLIARNSESLAFVDLPSTYEGSVYLSSSASRPRINVDEGVDDPKGEGRYRQVVMKHSGHEVAVGHEVAGDIRWVGDINSDGDGNQNKGSVKVVTEILDARLSL